MPAVLTTTAVDTFEHIIRQQTVVELVPLLLNLSKTDVLAVRRKTRSLQRELDQFVELEKGLIGSSWGRRGTPEQDWMLFLAGLRTYSRKEALASSFGVRWIEPGEQPAFWTILEHTRPDWLGDWLQRWNAGDRWGIPQYRLLRELENRQLIDYQPSLVAASTPALLHEISRRYQAVKTVPANLAEQVLAELQADATLLTRDLPLVFDFDTSVDTAQVWAQDERPTRNGVFHGNWQEWYAQHPPQTVRWAELLPALVESGHLDRADLLTRCLLALRRDFRRPLLTWFRNLYLALRPDPADQLARQTELVELLAHPLPLVVNFALDQLKGFWPDPAFDTAPLLQYAEGLMTRADLKTSLRGLLTGLDKLQRRTPALAPALAPLYVGALANADAGVQERAARLLAAQLGARKPVLSTEEVAATQAAISQYADLLGAAARGLLTPYLAAPGAADELPAAAYAPQTEFVPELSADTAIEPVRDWHELLFLTGQVLQHNDPVALERWVDGLIRLRRQFPAGYAEALQPYLVQVLPALKGRSEEAQAAILHQPQSTGHIGLVQALLQGWAGGFTVPLVEQVRTREKYSISDPLVELEQQRLVVAERRLSESRPLPLLSTPTHFPAWVAPTALVQRLLAHETARQLPAPADLALALARTARAHAADAAAARRQLPQLRHEGLRELLTWFLAPEPPPLPAAVTGRKSVLKQFAERLSQLIPRPATPPTLEEALPWLWAVAARTRQPEAPRPELRALTEYPGVAAPWAPNWQVAAKSHRYVDTWKIGRPEHVTRWQALELRPVAASRAVPSALLLYSLHACYAHEQYASWQLQADFAFLVNMLPNYPTPLYWHALRSADIRSGEQSSSGLISQALTSLLYPGPVFDEAATLLLAVGLGHGAAECRVLALEVLLAALDNGRLDAGALGNSLGQLLAAELMPVQRLADTLAQARAIGPRTDDALRQVLQAALPLLPATPLRNTKKLLDLYADLLGRTRQAAPPAVQTRLQAWAGVAALKKTATGLLEALA